MKSLQSGQLADALSTPVPATIFSHFRIDPLSAVSVCLFTSESDSAGGSMTALSKSSLSARVITPSRRRRRFSSALYYDYTYASPEEKARGQWCDRRLLGVYFPTSRLK